MWERAWRLSSRFVIIFLLVSSSFSTLSCTGIVGEFAYADGGSGNIVGKFGANVLPSRGQASVGAGYECLTEANCVGPTS